MIKMKSKIMGSFGVDTDELETYSITKNSGIEHGYLEFDYEIEYVTYDNSPISGIEYAIVSVQIFNVEHYNGFTGMVTVFDSDDKEIYKFIEDSITEGMLGVDIIEGGLFSPSNWDIEEETENFLKQVPTGEF